MSLPVEVGQGYIRTCLLLPPQVNSKSIWAGRYGEFIGRSLPTIQLQICLIYFGTLFFHTFLCRFRIPRFTSMIITGLIYGNTFNKTWAEKVLFSFDSQETLGLLSVFGYIMCLFYIGVKTDMSMVHRTGKTAMFIGAIAVFVPFLCGILFHYFISYKYLETWEWRKLPFIIGMFSLSPFPVISSVLSELKILNSELGRLGLSSALVSEMLSLFLGAMVSCGNTFNYEKTKALADFVAVVVFVVLLVFVLRPAMFWIIKQTPEGCPVNDHYVYCIFILALSSSYASNHFDFLAIFGPYLIGLAIPDGPPLGTAIIKKIDTFVNGVLMPVFVTTCAMRVDLKQFITSVRASDGKFDSFTIQVMFLILLVFVIKLGVCMIPPLYTKMPFQDALTLSLIMNCKGIVEMAANSFLRDISGLPDNVFTLLMICLALNATVLPIILAYYYDPSKKYASYTKRNIVDLKPNSELRILTCIHRPDNIPPAISVLEAAYPTREDPISVFVLHLIELIGRASPVFISHQLQKKTKSRSALAENVLEAFTSFEEDFAGALTVNTFTAVSPAEMMNDDICTLALDKLTSLIILPFHQKDGNSDSVMEVNDKSIRDLNQSVLERAPCSVGILIERAQRTHIFSPETPYSVCLIFIGGKDDREAFYLAKRMTKNPHVKLTVVRFKGWEEKETRDWETVLENEMLEEVKEKQRIGDAEVRYREEIVKDGPETALIVRALVSEYDLMIVGRRDGKESAQTSGLLQWSEIPELGVLGDLLAFVRAPASILVIQQQRITGFHSHSHKMFF